MTPFGWKRKAGKSILKDVSKAFEAEAKGDEDEAIENGDVDWLTLAPKRKCLQLEDGIAKSNRLRVEGTTLAEAERFWEAIGKWDEAILLTPYDERLLEMKAQALLSLGEVYPAVCMAKKAVGLNASWWIGHQTLGRALLGMGEVKSALRSFSHAYHLNPTDKELWEDDLIWAAELVQRRLTVEREALLSAENEPGGVKIMELNGNGDHNEAVLRPLGNAGHCESAVSGDVDGGVAKNVPELRRLPANYVAMRD